MSYYWFTRYYQKYSVGVKTGEGILQLQVERFTEEKQN